MDSQIDHLKEEIDCTDNIDKLDKLKKSYLILKQKVCRSHDLIKLYNDKLKECERIKIDLDLANKETKKMTNNYNLTLAKVIKLELQNAEYKKDIESMSNTISAHETKMAGDKQHLQQLTCKMKELEEAHMDKIMQLDLDKSLLQENIKELKQQLKALNKTCDLSKRKCNKRQNIENDANPQGTISTADVAVNTVSNKVSTVDVAVNTVGSNIKANTLIEKSIMTDISCNINKNNLYPLFCDECESILSNPCDKICRSMTKHPQLIEIISSPIKSLRTESTFITEKGKNLTNNCDKNEICNFKQSSKDLSANNNSPISPTVSLKPELSLQDRHVIRSKPFNDLTVNPIPLSNQLKGLSNAVQTPCLISESNSLSNLASSTNSIHILEKLEEKMKRLEKRIKKQSRKKKQLPTNHLQYYPHMNCYPNDILSQNLSLNMASTFWNEVKNLMNDKQNKYAENQKKRHESKVCKFNSKKIKLKHQLKQNNMLSRNNAWNVEPMAIDDSTETKDLKTDTALHNFSSKINFDKDKCCSTLLEESTENTTLFSTSKKIPHARNVQDESFELSLCENVKDDTSNFMDDTNLSDFNDTQCYTPTVKITPQQTNDIPFTSERFNTKNKNYFKNKIIDTITTTATTTTISTSTVNTTASSDTTVINNIVTTTGKAFTASTSATMNDKDNESETEEQTSISKVNEFSNTEFIVEKIPEIVNNVSPNARIANSIDKYKVNNSTIVAANSITVANTYPTTNFTTTITCLTSSIITTTNNISTNCSNKSTITTSAGIVTRVQKRKFQHNLQMDLSTVKKNNETACNVENNEICNNKIMEDTSENEIDNESDISEYCISPKKQCISDEVEISSNQDDLTEQLNINQAVHDVTVPLTCKATDSLITRTNLNKSNNYNDTSKVNACISKEGKFTEAKIMNSTGFITNVHNNKCMQEQSNNDSVKAGHSNSIRNKANKTRHARIMKNLENLKRRPSCKISNLELSNSSGPISEDNRKNNRNKCAPQVAHYKNSEIKNNEIKCTSQILCKKNFEMEHNEDNPIPQILCKKNNKTKHNKDRSTPQILNEKNTEIEHSEDECTPQILSKKNTETEYSEDECTPQILNEKNTEMEHSEDECTPQILSKKNTEMEHSEDECTPQILSKKNTEMEHNDDESAPQILNEENTEMEHSEDECTPQTLSKKNTEMEHSEDECTPQILSKKNTEMEHSEDECTPQILSKKNTEMEHNEDESAPQILNEENTEMEHSEDECTPQTLSKKNTEMEHSEDECTPQILSKKNTEMEHNEDKSASQILHKKNNKTKHNEDIYTRQILNEKNTEMEHSEDELEMEHNEDESTPQVLHKKNNKTKHNEDIYTPQILNEKNTEMEDSADELEMEHNEDESTLQILHKKNNETKHNKDRCTSQILNKKNIEMEHNEDECMPQILSKKNTKIKYNENKYTSQSLSNKNSEITNNIMASYCNVNRREECNLRSKSVDPNIQRSDVTSLPDESEDEWSEVCGSDIEKNYNPTNTKQQSRLQQITDEAQRFSCINGINKSNRIDMEVPTILTDIAVCNENNVGNQSHKMDIIASENTENIDNNTSTSLEVVSPVMLLENHLNNNKCPKGLRTTKKALKKMENICKLTDKFVDRQLHRILSNCDWGMEVHTDVVNKLSSMCTVRIVANGIVEFMLDRAMHNLDKSYTPPAPLMTSVQQRITALLVDLEVKMPTVIKFVQIGIEFKIFRLNKTPMLHQIQNLIRLYVVLARIQKDREKVRILCCDALYCLGLNAIPVLYTALTSWPEIFPKFTGNTESLPKCMAFIISTFQATDFPQLQPLKGLISSYYKFKAGNYVTITLMEELLNSLEENHSGTGIVSLKTAIILLAKKEGTSWTYTKIIQANLLPKIVNRKYSSIFEAFCLLGHLLRSFPVEKSNSIVSNIIEQLSDLIESGEGSEDQQEGVISALLSLCRHNFEKVVVSTMKWTPTKPMRAITIDQYNALFSFRTSMHWRNFMRKNLK